MTYRVRKIDANQNEIVKHLRQCGVSVAITSSLGNGFPDIVCSTAQGINYLFEIKDPSKPPSQRKLTEDEKMFKDNWKGQYDIIETYEDALKIMGIK